MDSLVPGTSYTKRIVTAESSGASALTSTTGNGAFSALQLTSVAAPELSTLALAGLGATHLFSFRRRKYKPNHSTNHKHSK